ncbi:hypothetical protein B0H11DRAFT_1914185 [Mycena galericulata]|nr:hypothetical protein B0H11DRAFT_1914185 [Mycena galericulata]
MCAFSPFSALLSQFPSLALAGASIPARFQENSRAALANFKTVSFSPASLFSRAFFEACTPKGQIGREGFGIQITLEDFRRAPWRSLGANSGDGVSQCNTGSTQCYNSIQQAGSLSAILGLLGIFVGDLTTPMSANSSLESHTLSDLYRSGLNCITFLLGSNSCAEQLPVCCTGNNYVCCMNLSQIETDTLSGLIVVACDPINVSA